MGGHLGGGSYLHLIVVFSLLLPTDLKGSGGQHCPRLPSGLGLWARVQGSLDSERLLVSFKFQTQFRIEPPFMEFFSLGDCLSPSK